MSVHLYVPICYIGSPGVWPVGPNKVRLSHPGKGSVLSAPLAYNGDHNDDDDDDYGFILSPPRSMSLSNMWLCDNGELVMVMKHYIWL